MEKESMSLKLMFNADDVNAALEAALNERLLCDTCTGKIETQQELSQSDFCSACQDAINSQLALTVERRMKEVLTRVGLPPDSLEISKN